MASNLFGDNFPVVDYIREPFSPAGTIKYKATFKKSPDDKATVLYC